MTGKWSKPDFLPFFWGFWHINHWKHWDGTLAIVPNVKLDIFLLESKFSCLSNIRLKIGKLLKSADWVKDNLVFSIFHFWHFLHTYGWNGRSAPCLSELWDNFRLESKISCQSNDRSLVDRHLEKGGCSKKW